MHKNRSLCPCQSGVNYTLCCARWHEGDEYLQAPNARALMRSRYSAIVLDLRLYLLETWHPDTRPKYIEPPEEGLKWLGLKIGCCAELDATHATVEFTAKFRWEERVHHMHEVSQFEKVDSQWFYVDGQVD